MPCPYANLFGAPNTGVHAYRVANIAVVDLGLTVILAGVIAWLTKRSFGWLLLGLLLLGIVLHRAFGVRTTVDQLLFPSSTCT